MPDAKTWHWVGSFLSMIGMYIIVSISMTESVKYLESYFARGDFDFPLLITEYVFIVQYLSLIFLRNVIQYKTKIGGSVLGVRQPCSLWKAKAGHVHPSAIGKLAIPVGLLVAGQYSLDNLALSSISVSLETMVTSSSTLFVLSFSILLGLERFSAHTCGYPQSILPEQRMEAHERILRVVILITAGLTLVCKASFDDGNIGGALLALGGAMCVGLRWPLSQIMLQVVNLEPLTAMYTYLPASMLALGIAFATIEGRTFFSQTDLTAADMLAGFGILTAIAFGCLILYFLELNICRLTSAVTQQLASIVKQCVQVGVSVWLYHDSLDTKQVYGFVIIMIGVLLYTYERYLDVEKAGGIHKYSEIHKALMVRRLAKVGMLEGVHFEVPPPLQDFSAGGKGDDIRGEICPLIDE